MNGVCEQRNLESAGSRQSREPGSFERLPAEAFQELVHPVIAYPKGAILFLEGQAAAGVFILYRGEVKLSMGSSDGKRLIVRVAQPGDILGLMPTLGATVYEATAESVSPCEAAFVGREQFRRLIAKYPEVSLMAAKQISAQYQAACEQLRTVGLLASVRQKLARLLLDQSDRTRGNGSCVPVKLSLTHEEIAECIGTTRETVTRALSELKHRHLVEAKGSRLTIVNRAALETLIGA